MILENHLHFIAQAPELDKCVAGFKAYTARRIIDHLQRQQAERLLQRLHFAKAAHKRDREYQFWQEGVHAEMILNEAMMRQNLDYIHANPVKRGYVNLPQHWRYSSAANYEGLVGLMEIDVWFKKAKRIIRDRWASRCSAHPTALYSHAIKLFSEKCCIIICHATYEIDDS
ncbi:hypothetical protein MKFW12EY_28820 [Methylomonas koyamae]|nr:hypothetical protein MKFW12EY_28820 [Methylomonas koyamae]